MNQEDTTTNEARLNRAAGIVAAQAGQNHQAFVEWLCNGGLVQMVLSHFGAGQSDCPDCPQNDKCCIKPSGPTVEVSAAVGKPWDTLTALEKAPALIEQLEDASERFTRYSSDPVDGLLAEAARVIQALSAPAPAVEGLTAEAKLINIALGLMDAPPGANLVVEVAKLVSRLAPQPAASLREQEDDSYDAQRLGREKDKP